jgi:pilus assembly protein CpaC
LVLCLLQRPARAQAPSGLANMTIAVQDSERRQMSTKKKITSIAIANPGVVTATAATENTALFVGQSPGSSTVTMTDEDGTKESFVVTVVAFNIKQLDAVLRKTVPTANVRLIPAGNNAVVLEGTVDRTEDLLLIQQTAQSVVGPIQIINGLRVGGPQQVQLDVIVAQVSRNELRAMAFNFLTSSRYGFFGSTVGQAVANPVTVGTGGVFSAGGALLGTPGLPNGLPTNLLFGVVHDNWGFLGFLQALRTEGVLKLMAEPRLVAMSGRQASFLSGGEQAIPVPAGLGQVGVQFEEFGTRVNFVPVVLGNGKIHLEVEPEVSALDPASGTTIQGTVVPGRATQRVRTTVELESGQTFVIGGLIQHTVTGTTQKVPVLGDLPFLGAAFSSKTFNESEQELLILVTPHLVDAADCGQFPKCLPGQETRTPDDFELFLEGILEAPRGPREVFPGGRYQAAYRNGPSASTFPCGPNGDNAVSAFGAAGAAGAAGPVCPGCAADSYPRMPGSRNFPATAQPVSIRKVEAVQGSAPEPIRLPVPKSNVGTQGPTDKADGPPQAVPAEATPASVPPPLDLPGGSGKE